MKTNHTISEPEFELIENWLMQRMEPPESQAFSERLKNNPELQEKVQQVRVIMLGIQEALVAEKLTSYRPLLMEEPGKSNKPARVLRFQRWLVAASVILIAAVSALLLFNNTSQHEQLYADFYKRDPGLLSAMSTTENYPFEKAMIDFKTGNYNVALEAWEPMLKDTPGNDTLQYFIGAAYMAENSPDLALKHFQEVLKNEQSRFYKDASWYAGLILLKQNKPEEAIPLIQGSNHPNKEKLLQKIDASKK